MAQPEIGLVFIIIGLDLLRGDHRIQLLLKELLPVSKDQQGAVIFLDLPVKFFLLIGEGFFGPLH